MNKFFDSMNGKDEKGDQSHFLNLVKTTVGIRLTWKGLTND